MASKRFGDLFRALRSRRMLSVFLLGFSSGLPIMLVYSSLKVWFRREEIDLSTIGYISWVTIPYSLNFLWAPLLDRFIPLPIGRRRSWILIAQIGIILSLIGIYFSDPKLNLQMIILLGIVLSFFSATQDIGIDAYRREILSDDELGVGAAIGVYGYRIAMLIASGFGLWVVDASTLNLSFNQSFLMMASFMLIGVLTTIFIVKEPETEFKPHGKFKETVVEPFVEFLSRHRAVFILLFILLYKIGDAIAGSMLGPFYVDVGYSNRTIAEVTKGFGFFSSMAGLFLGGSLIYRLGIYPSLWIFGILQAVSTLSFSLLTITGPNWWALVGVIGFEDISSGMGTAALVAYMGLLANKRFTATQYAMLSSLASFGRTVVSGWSGKMIESLGYAEFFIVCALIAVPGLLVLSQISPRRLELRERRLVHEVE